MQWDDAVLLGEKEITKGIVKLLPVCRPVA